MESLSVDSARVLILSIWSGIRYSTEPSAHRVPRSQVRLKRVSVVPSSRDGSSRVRSTPRKNTYRMEGKLTEPV